MSLEQNEEMGNENLIYLVKDTLSNEDWYELKYLTELINLEIEDVDMYDIGEVLDTLIDKGIVIRNKLVVDNPRRQNFMYIFKRKE